MQNIKYQIIPDPVKNSIEYSKNYRIFTTLEPLRKAIRITGFSEILDIGSANRSNIYRRLRYSTNRGDWSLWYDFTEIDFTELLDLSFDEADVFFEIKYEYDDNTYDQLAEPIQVERIVLNVMSTVDEEPVSDIQVQCSDEKCPALVTANEAMFKPYEMDSAIGIAHELSIQTNKIFGHQVIYFKTEPDRDGGDFIFKEWTLVKTTQRRCIKVIVPENKFPDNRPNYAEFGVDFEVPFEIHVDHVYFQQMFGRNSQPRKRDYLFFPILNRMYEIQGAYLYRGFMMEPMYWKIQLTKFHPNLDMHMKAEDRVFLDNLIISSDDLFGKEAGFQKNDALDSQQFKTISNKFDESRRSLHQDLRNKVLDFTYNYAPLIEYYYDVSSVVPTVKSYDLQSFGSPNETKSQIVSNGPPAEVFAYQDSDIFKEWMANLLVTGDSNVNSNLTTVVPIKVNGPKDSHSVFGKYAIIEGYKTIALKKDDRKSVVVESDKIQFMQKQNAVVYKILASTVSTPNMTFFELFNFNRGTQDVTFIKGYDDINKSGLIISGRIVDQDGTTGQLTIYVQINETIHTFAIGNIQYAKWYALIVPVSSQYGQVEVNLYSFVQDLSNVKNFIGVNKIAIQNSYKKIGQFSFDTNSNFCLLGANMCVANVRLFNTMVKPEDHEFIISQLFVRDESVLAMIDNCRPRLNAPFVAISR